MEQQAPSTSATQHIENGIQNLAHRVLPWPATKLWSGQVRHEVWPLGVGHIG